MTDEHDLPSAPSAPTSPRRRARQCNADYRWTVPKVQAFLRALEQCGRVAEAARAVGMSRQAAYRLRARAPNFADFWDGALVEAERRKAAARQARTPVHPMLAKVRLPHPPAPSDPISRTGERR